MLFNGKAGCTNVNCSDAKGVRAARKQGCCQKQPDMFFTFRLISSAPIGLNIAVV